MSSLSTPQEDGRITVLRPNEQAKGEEVTATDASQEIKTTENTDTDQEADKFILKADDYAVHGSAKTRGTANPSIMDNTFWKYMIHNDGTNAWAVRQELNARTVWPQGLFASDESQEDSNADNNSDEPHDSDASDADEPRDPEVKEYTGPEVESPTWCFDRFGQTRTNLPDGRIVLIGGEHEDYYDPDFFIYNDVVVVDSKINPPSPKAITIYGYPTDIFLPTDNHTATLYQDPVDGKQYIYIVGGLGYTADSHRTNVNVFRLDLTDFSIQKMETTGAKPEGCLCYHRAELAEGADGLKSIISIRTSTLESKLRERHSSDVDDDEEDEDNDVESSEEIASTSSNPVKVSIDGDGEDANDIESVDSASVDGVTLTVDGLTLGADADAQDAEPFVEKQYLLDLRTLIWSSPES